MPRDLPLGNGSLLVAFDQTYQIRDLYWPHVGQENHALGHPFRTGVWVDGQFCWFDDARWQRSIKYQPETLVSAVVMEHPNLRVRLECADMVDFHEDLLIRRMEIENLQPEEREIRVFFHHDFHIAGNDIGDTAYYEPERRAIFHYKDKYWFMMNGAVLTGEGQPRPGWEPSLETFPGILVGVHQWACGLKEIRNLQGTWKDAEDGELACGVVAHGSVDSTVGFNLQVKGGQKKMLYYWMAVGKNFEAVTILNRMVRQRGPQFFIDRTVAFWRLWLQVHLPELSGLPEKVKDQYERSLLTIRTQVDEGGAIIAANDSDISSDVRDTYSYMWSRDGALVAHALNKAGYLDLPRAFFQFCDQVHSREGYMLHKYNPDGSLASSWLPWAVDGAKNLPIQEDETALVLWALWEHFSRYGDVAFIKPLYRTLICPLADFMASFRDPHAGLPLASYDLWEERLGILSWTVAATWGGLTAAARFAEAFGEIERANHYHQAAREIKAGTEAHLWQPALKRFVRMVNVNEKGEWQIDETLDASLVGLWQFGMYKADDPKILPTMQAIRDQLWVKTSVGGVARYTNDHYHQVSQDIGNVPGNPWFICTLWLAEWLSLVATKPDELQPALELLEWVAGHALPSGILAEQVDPYTDQPVSVSPLTWSHAAYVSTVLTYLQRKRHLKAG
ncbi:MAG: glycoside hydrolase family 15 [Anaerolineales bacterium]|nr:glycoside hydrolase family 15 protein [Anaerolineae bacterium]PWB53590.1 MAG: glycoside hydrolase family 15 [Anaerolineales bacterium]